MHPTNSIHNSKSIYNTSHQKTQTTLANRTGVVFALNTPMREIRYLQTRVLTGIQAIDQFILYYNIHLINRERTHLQILRMKHQADEIQQHINDGIDLCTSASTSLQYYKPVFNDFHSILEPMVFILDSYANEITIKEKRTALNKLDGISPPPPPPRPSIPAISNDDVEYDFSFTSSSEDDFTSDDE
jgi:hypothetical protein